MPFDDKVAKQKADGEAAVLGAIAAMADADRALGERLHPLVKNNAPDLVPRTWYGMPAYANDAGKIICYFRPAQRFHERYLTFGFNDQAKLDEGTMWPTSWALTNLTAADEERIAALLKRAVG